MKANKQLFKTYNNITFNTFFSIQLKLVVDYSVNL